MCEKPTNSLSKDRLLHPTSHTLEARDNTCTILSIALFDKEAIVTQQASKFTSHPPCQHACLKFLSTSDPLLITMLKSSFPYLCCHTAFLKVPFYISSTFSASFKLPFHISSYDFRLLSRALVTFLLQFHSLTSVTINGMALLEASVALTDMDDNTGYQKRIKKKIIWHPFVSTYLFSADAPTAR